MKQALLRWAPAAAATVVALGLTSMPAAGQGGTGTIIGHVRYMGPTPVNPVIRMGADPRCNKLYVGKRPTSQAFVGAGGGGRPDHPGAGRGGEPRHPTPH